LAASRLNDPMTRVLGNDISVLLVQPTSFSGKFSGNLPLATVSTFGLEPIPPNSDFTLNNALSSSAIRLNSLTISVAAP
jgi:hypothetical protein